jgi:hypothetical protein
LTPIFAWAASWIIWNEFVLRQGEKAWDYKKEPHIHMDPKRQKNKKMMITMMMNSSCVV